MNIFTVIGILVVSTLIGTVVGVALGSYFRKEMDRRDNEEWDDEDFE